MIKNFHREQEKKLESQLEREKPLNKMESFDNVNRIFNNDSSVGDSSIMSSNANVIVNFKNRKSGNASDEEEAKKKDPERLQSAKTEK